MGASAAAAAAFLVYLLLEPAERRVGTLVLALETLILAILSAAVISATSFEAWSGINPVPLLCLAVGVAALIFADRKLTAPSIRLLSGKKWSIITVIIVLLILFSLFALVAWSITGSASLPEGGALRRAAYPSPGAYTLTTKADGSVSVHITSQNRQNTMMHTDTVLYDGEADGAEFTVPDDSLVVYFDFHANEPATVYSAEYTGESGSGAIPLNYVLLPGFIANRIQGIFANQNAIQRSVFFSDGMKLFQRSPVIGLGMGAFENSILGVQSFFYETKYAHNHYIQLLVETGIIGLALFICLLVFSFLPVWRSRKTAVLAPVLGACLAFMSIHAAVEVIFSFFAYLPIAYGVFVLCGLCGETEKGQRERPKTIAVFCSSAIIAIFIVLLGLNIMAQREVEQNLSLESLENASNTDPFEWADYMLSYVFYTGSNEVSPEIRANADEYAERLSRVNSNSIPLYLADYYFKTGRTQQGFDMIEKYVTYTSSNPSTWESAFALMRSYVDGSDAYIQGVRRTVSLLEQWNAENMGNIELSEDIRSFLFDTGIL